MTWRIDAGDARAVLAGWPAGRVQCVKGAQMKLSEAIRTGAAKRPQAFSDYIDHWSDGTVTTCALGAAYEALMGVLPPSSRIDQGHVLATLKSLASSDVLQEVILLNDAEWTRAEIADYLAGRGL